MLTRKAVIQSATPTAAEILCVFDDNGIPRNVTITDAALAQELGDTPVVIPNPDRAPLEARAFAAAEAQIAAE